MTLLGTNWSNIAENNHGHGHVCQISLDCFETTWKRYYITGKDRVMDNYVRVAEVEQKPTDLEMRACNQQPKHLIKCVF